MLVSEIIDLAQNAELKQLAVKSDPVAIRGYINMGILEIHKRFNLIQQQAIINMVDGVNEYMLDGNDVNVQMNLGNNSYLMIDEAYDYDGEQLYINDENEICSISTPAFNKVEVPDTVLTPTQSLNLIYRAAPAFLTADTDAIPLPPQFFEALLHYIGYRGHSSLRGDREYENNTHYMRFENSCNQIKADGLYIDDSLKSHKFENRGFV